MTTDDNAPRGYQDYKIGQQHYAVIEFCNTPEALWGKLTSGHWDWLGVKDDGRRHTFVLGRPPVSRLTGSASWERSEVGATGDHYVIVEVPARKARLRQASRELCLTPESARELYASKGARLAEPDGSSALYRVSLYVDGRKEAEQVVVRTMPNLYPPSKKRRGDEERDGPRP